MRTILYVLTGFALCSCAGGNFLKQKYTRFSHQKNHTTIPAISCATKTVVLPVVQEMPATDSALEKVPGTDVTIIPQKEKNDIIKKTVIKIQKAVPSIRKIVTPKPVWSASVAATEEEEEERMSYGTWFFLIFFLIPGCLGGGIVLLFSEFWIGLLLIGLSVLMFFYWLHADPELKW